MFQVWSFLPNCSHFTHKAINQIPPEIRDHQTDCSVHPQGGYPDDSFGGNGNVFERSEFSISVVS